MHADAYDCVFYLVRIPRDLTYDIHKHVYIQSQNNWFSDTEKLKIRTTFC